MAEKRVLLGANLPIDYKKKLKNIIAKTGETNCDFIKRMIENQYDIVVEKKSPFKNLEDKLDSFSLLTNKQIESTNYASKRINEALHSNYEYLRENKDILRKILNCCIFMTRELIRFSAHILHLVIKTNNVPKNIFKTTRDLSKNDGNKYLNSLLHDIDKETNNFIQSFQDY